MPTVIKQGSTVKATYTYLADGTKTKVVNALGAGFDYIGSFKYNRSNSNITLESVATAGGRTYKTSSGYEARYFISDHLGSTRLVTNSSGTVLEQNDYMLYGERHTNSALVASTNPYLYNGKESQKDFGINYIDSEARFQRLDGAFNSIDPLSEENYWISPYAYGNGNPIKYIDNNGKKARVAVNHENKTVTIYANIYLSSKQYSSKELTRLSEQIKNEINSTWNNNWTYNNNGKEYAVNFKVKVGLGKNRKNSKDESYANYIEIENIKRSFVRENNYNGVWRPIAADSPHEFGHIVGLRDRYNDVTDKNGKKQSISHDGWEDNIMGASEKPVQQRNIDAILLPIFEQINNRNWFERLFQNNNIFHINKQDR